MQTTSQPAAAALPELDATIDKIADLQLQYKALESQIEAEKAKARELMRQAKVIRQVTAAGAEALVIETTKRLWRVEDLKQYLTPKQFKVFCPPTPKVADLGKALDSKDPELAPKLRKCFEAVPGESFTVRPGPDRSAVMAGAAVQAAAKPKIKGDPPNLFGGG